MEGGRKYLQPPEVHLIFCVFCMKFRNNADYAKKKVFLTDLRGNSLWVLNPCFFLKSLCFIQEWDDYRENKKDYSGLKIENLKIEEQISEDEEEETEINEVSVEK